MPKTKLICNVIALKIKNQLGCPESVQICRQIANLKVGHTIYKTVAAVDPDWDKVVEEQPVFLQKAYLASLEKVNAHQQQFRYLIFERNGKKVALAYFQIINITQNIGIEPKDSLRTKAMKKGVNSLKFHLLVCGNAFITGDFGFQFNEDLISGEDAFLALNEAIETLKKEDKKINIVLIKDFQDPKSEQARCLLNFGFAETYFQPNMQVFLRKNWHSIQDYSNDIASKYKKRHRSIVTKAAEMQVIVLSPAQIEAHQAQIMAYYNEIIDRSEFNLGTIPDNYFYECAKNMPQNFMVKGYFYKGYLAGFISYIFNNHEMESHYIGYDAGFNNSHKIYNFILYDLLETAIKHKKKILTYGRTAMEIKSTIGAVGTDMKAFLWVKNPILRLFLKPILANLATEQWQPRNPFKE